MCILKKFLGIASFYIIFNPEREENVGRRKYGKKTYA